MRRSAAVCRLPGGVLAALALAAATAGSGAAAEAPGTDAPGLSAEPGFPEGLPVRAIRQLPPGATGLPVGMTDYGRARRPVLSEAAQSPLYPATTMPVEALEPLPVSSFEEYASLAIDPSRETGLRQFGYEHFLRATSTFAPVADIPVGPDYLLGPGDEVVVNIWGRVQRTDRGKINRDGTLTLPVVGGVSVSGVRFGKLRDVLRTYYDRHFVGYEMEASLARLRTIAVHVVGAARRPGTYELGSTATIFSALSAAAGPTKHGSMREVRLVRDGKVAAKLDLYDLFLAGSAPGDERLMSGDVVFVPRSRALVAVGGAVRSPGIYELKGAGAELGAVIEYAGGLAFEAAPSRVQIERVGADERIALESVDMSDEGAAAVGLRDGDIVRVESVPMKLESVVYLQGNLARPGKRAYRPGMRVSDLLESEQLGTAEFWSRRKLGLSFPAGLPLEETGQDSATEGGSLEPAEAVAEGTDPEETEETVADEPASAGAAEDALAPPPGEATPKPYWDFALVRRIAMPELEELLIPFNLGKAVLERDPAEDIELRPQDTVIVYAESDFKRAKVVRSAGAIERPGMFPFSVGMTVRDLVALSGGLTRDAYVKSAELTRTWIVGEELRTTRTEIDLGAALASAAPSIVNPVLKEDDYLFVRRVQDGVENMTVVLEGEFRFPGTYRIRPGERLSDVLERAGGFTDKSYLRGAVFVRESTRCLQQEQMDRAIVELESQNAAFTEAMGRGIADPEVAAATSEAAARRRSTIERLKQAKAQGRIVIALAAPKAMKDSPDDLVLEPGDRLTVPTRPSTVTVMGSVYTSTAVVYRPGQTVAGYIAECGGTAPNADGRNIYVLRADGSVASRQQRGLGGFVWREKEGSWTVRDLLTAAPGAGDIVVVPERLEPRIYPMKLAKDLTQILYQIAVTAGVVVAAF
jgi:protein involved in polysaccharide export with SLBB domain